MSADRTLPTSRSFVRRFWRGELSLAASYGVALPLYLAITALLLGVSFVMHRQAFNPYMVVAAVAFIWGAIVLGQFLQSVGVWRSAQRHRRVAAEQGRLGSWGVAAQSLVLIGALGLAYTVVKQGVPQMRESWRMAFEGDPDIPRYSMRLMHDNTEAEIAGGFKYGLARDAARLFASAPNLKVVHLNSGGGRLGEAMELAKLIRARGLITYTSASCVSACTIAFASGREHYLKSGAKIGFHRAIFAGTESTAEMRDLLRAAGIESAFVERAVAQPASSIWYPTEQELEKGNVILAVVDSYRFAASGLGIYPVLDDFKTALRRVPSFAAIEAADPRIFENTAELYKRRYFEGASDGRIADEIRTTRFAPLLRERLVTADDGLLIDYARLMADQYEALRARDADICFEVATRSATRQSVLLLPRELQQREIDLSDRVMRLATRRTPDTAERLTASSLALSRTLIDRYGADNVRLLTQPAAVTPRQHDAFCRLSIAMLRAIADLPPPEAGAMMSNIFAGMAKAAAK